MNEKVYVATEQTQKEIKDAVSSINDKIGSGSVGGGISPHITVAAPTGCTVTVKNGETVLTPTEHEGVWEQNVPYFGTWEVSTEIESRLISKTVEVSALTLYRVRLSKFEAAIKVLAPEGATITCVGNGESQSITSTGEDSIPVYAAGKYTVTRNKNGKIAEREIEVTENGATVPLVLSYRWGYKKMKSEGQPSARVVYLFDAEGMTPAKVDLSTGAFDPGDWGDAFFVKKNRPVMLKYDRTVDYELNHSDQTKKLDGSPSDISDTSYQGNAMSEIPLGWVNRYEDSEWEYEIVCEHQWDKDYKAYAHTRADGSIADAFYWSMFGGSGSASQIRSLADQTAAASLTAPNEIAGAQANGDGWYIHTWSQREYIRTLLILMGKSTHTQAVYGNGNCRSGSQGSVLRTGTLKDKGQFWGSSDSTKQVKVFYIERMWGDQWDRTAGIIDNKGPIYYKMTPEGAGYQTDNVTGYTNSGVTLTGTVSQGYINATKCGEFGCIPTAATGSETQFECDGAWWNQTQLNYLIAGASADNAPGVGGAFAFSVDTLASRSHWTYGCGLSAEKPVAA